MNDREYTVLTLPELSCAVTRLPVPNTFACDTEPDSTRPSEEEKPAPSMILPVDFSVTLTLTST